MYVHTTCIMHHQPHTQVTAVDDDAKDAIVAAGGSVTTVYYNQLALRALLKPEWFAKKQRLLPRSARIPPKLLGKFDKLGEVPGAGVLASKWVEDHVPPAPEEPPVSYARFFASEGTA